MKVINYPELVERREAIVDTLKENRERYLEGSFQYDRFTTLIGCTNRHFTHAYVTGDTECFDEIEGDLVELVNDVVAPETVRDPAFERKAQKVLDSAVLIS
jgi:hypothetical protein